MSTNSENNKRIAKNTLFLYMRMLLIMGVTLYTSRVVLRVLGVEDFGIYNVVGGIVTMCSFLNGAMSQSTQRFLAFEIGRGNPLRLAEVFSLSMTIHIGIALIVLLLAETIGLWFLITQMNIPESRMEAAQWVYQFALFSFVISMVQAPYNAAIITRERMHVYAYISIVEVVLKLVVAFLLECISFDKLKLYGALIFLVTVLIALFYRCYCVRNFQECHYKLYWSKTLYKTISSFAGWSMFGTLAWISKSQGLNLILNIFYGPVLNASYGIASQVNTAINSFVQNFTTALNPQIIKSYANDDRNYMIQLLFRGAKFSYFLLLLFSIPLLIETEFVLKCWLKVVPGYAVAFTRLVIINSLLESFTYAMGTSIQATGKVKWYQIIVGGTILLNIPLAWILLRLNYSPSVVFIVSIVISCITLSERLLILKIFIAISLKRFIIQVFGRALLVTILSSSIIVLIKDILANKLISFAGFFLILVCCVGSILLIIYFVGFTSLERDFFLRMIRSRLKR